MATSWNRWSRKLHRWGAILACLPLLLVIVSGLLLQVKKQVEWVQPPTAKGSTTDLVVKWPTILSAVAEIEEAQVSSWDDIDRLDVRPSKGVVKVRCKNRWEIQLDSSSGEILASNYRRSDFIESLHDGSFFSDEAKLWIFLPNGLVLLGLWVSGIYLWWLPIGARRKKRKKSKLNSTQNTNSANGERHD